MNNSPAFLNALLNEVSSNLYNRPRWLSLLNHEGKLLAVIGKDDWHFSHRKSADIAADVYSLILRNRVGLDRIGIGRYEYSIHKGDTGTIFVVDLDDTFYLCASFHHTIDHVGNFSSIDNVIESLIEQADYVMQMIFGAAGATTEETDEDAPVPESNDIMSDSAIDLAMDQFRRKLPGKPLWAMVVAEEGEVLGFSGNLHTTNESISDFARHLSDYLQFSERFFQETELQFFKNSRIWTGGGVLILSVLSLRTAPKISYLALYYRELQIPFERVMESGVRPNLYLILSAL